MRLSREWLKYYFGLVACRVKMKKKVLLVFSGVLLALVLGAVLLLPSMLVKSITLSVDEGQVRSVIYDPFSEDKVYLEVGQELNYRMVTTPSSGYVFSSCDYDREGLEMTTDKIKIKAAGSWRLSCKVSLFSDVKSNEVLLEVVK